jgi:hypothetical protein
MISRIIIPVFALAACGVLATEPPVREFAVRPETLYEVHVRLAGGTNGNAVAFMTELDAKGRTNTEHRLAFWPGYLRLQPHMDDVVSYLATTPAAVRVRFWITEPCEVETVAIREYGRVVYPGQDSANFTLNGHCERTNEQGVAADLGRWGGPPSARVVAGAGRGGSGALAITNGYMLGCGEVTTLPGRHYRFGAWFKGACTVSMEMRPITKGHEALFMGRMFDSVHVTTNGWQEVGMEAVALPGQDRLCPVFVIQPETLEPVYVDDIETIEMGQPAKKGKDPWAKHIL